MADASRTTHDQATVARLLERLIVPVEGRSDELLAQEWAVELAKATGAGVRAVHVATGAEDPAPDIFEYLARQCEAHNVEFEHEIVHGTDVAEELEQELDPTDLVVIGTRLLGTQYHLGSIASALVREAPCPVQVVRLK